MTAAFTLIVTGANGFVGRALLRSIASQMPDLPIIALVSDRSACKEILELPLNLTLRCGNLERLPPDFLPQTPHVLVHLAVKQIDRDGSGFDKVNIDGTKSLLVQVNDRTLGTIYNSSLSVYGEDPQRGVEESMPLNPQTALARSRAASELLVAESMKKSHRWALLLRPRFVLGEGDRFVLPGLLKLSSQRIGIGNGQQRFSIIDVDDYGTILLRLAVNMAQNGKYPQQQALNVGYRQPVSFTELIDALRERYIISDPLVKIATPLWLIRSCQRVPKLQALAAKLSLIGCDRYADSSKLAAIVGEDIVNRSPSIALKRAVTALES
ncbi:MAG: NAD(P)-dependent oxidoreductase [Cyanosarcina radialis HA8281-LM2]|nr:NAD(P)-dependent oxidoreductase [Cyanosarcina radialis HA8281-LM2]